MIDNVRKAITDRFVFSGDYPDVLGCGICRDNQGEYIKVYILEGAPVPTDLSVPVYMGERIVTTESGPFIPFVK